MLVKNLEKIPSESSRGSIEALLGELKEKNKEGLPFYFVMVGIPGSGKSTKAETIAEHDLINGIVFSSDTYREKLKESQSQEEVSNGVVFSTLYRDLKSTIERGQSVVLDATNVTMSTRRKALEAVKGLEVFKVAFVVNEPFEVCKLRNDLRETVLPEEVLKKFYYTFEIPMYFEGFDEISLLYPYVSQQMYGGYYEYLWELMAGLNQRTKWHRFNLLPHCIMAYDFLKEKEKRGSIAFDKPLLEAAKVHDIGKLYTGEKRPDGQYKYWHHANVGAYELISYLQKNMGPPNMDKREFLEFIFYVNQHMGAHMFLKEDTKESTREKYQELFGSRIYKNLMMLEEADNFASGREDR